MHRIIDDLAVSRIFCANRSRILFSFLLDAGGRSFCAIIQQFSMRISHKLSSWIVVGGGSFVFINWHNQQYQGVTTVPQDCINATLKNKELKKPHD